MDKFFPVTVFPLDTPAHTFPQSGGARTASVYNLSQKSSKVPSYTYQKFYWGQWGGRPLTGGSDPSDSC